MFIEIYGEPTKNFGYPDITRMTEGYITFAYKWETPKKIISLGVNQDEFKLYPYIDIVDIQLQEQKKNTDNFKQQQNIKQSTNDF